MNDLSFIARLKETRRAGWVMHSVPNPESVGDHTFGIAALALLYAKGFGLDEAKCLKLALVHDLEEALTGDVPYKPELVEWEKKEIAGEVAARKLFSQLPNGKELIDLWREYRNGTSREAVFVKDMDKIDMVLQALEYQRQGRQGDGLDDFFKTTEPRLTIPELKGLFAEIRVEYEKAKKKQ